MSSGLTARDRSIKGIIFEKSDSGIPNIVFESDNINCQKTESGDYCVASGSLSIRDEAKPLELGFGSQITKKNAGCRRLQHFLVELRFLLQHLQQ